MKSEQQEKARKLREQGYTIPEIEREVGCPRSSISIWVKDVVLSLEGQQKLQAKLNLNNEKKKKDIGFSKEQLIELIEKGYSLRRIATELKCTVSILKRYIKEQELQVEYKDPGNTKNKGDKGVGFVIANLMENDIHVALPISEHLPFDIIAIKDKKLLRISVKYRESREGKIEIIYQSTWVNSEGVQHRKIDKNTFDATAIYCPDTKQCYYVQNSESSGMITLRVDPIQHVGSRDSKYAKDYIDPNRLF